MQYVGFQEKHGGLLPLDRYLREQATPDMRRRVAACFVALNAEQRIAGYYTLASASMPLTDLPAATAKKLPRYPTVPAVRMGRPAIETAFQGRGLGAALLADALERAARSGIASYALRLGGGSPRCAANWSEEQRVRMARM